MKQRSSLFLAFALLLTSLMVSDQSFWIDEGSTGLFAKQPDLSSWWQYLNANSSSESQMPLSLFLIWLWAQAAGTGEWQLRSLNLIWAGLTLWASAGVGRRLAIPWLPVFFAIQPYFWFYTGEARSSALQIAAGSWLLLAFVEFLHSDSLKRRWAIIFISSALVLSCATMLAPISIFAIGIVGAVTMVRDGRRVPSRSLWVIALGAILSIPLGIYYAQTLARGAKGAELWHVDVKYLGYVIYESVGLTGLGPAHFDLRQIARSFRGLPSLLEHTQVFSAPFLCAIALGILAFLGRRALQRNPGATSPAGALLGVFLLGTALFFFVSLAAQKALWARHYAPVFPFYVAGLALLVAEAARSTRTWIYRPLAALFLTLLVCSSLSLRFAERHHRDDYRGASSFALDSLKAGKATWWVAAPEAAEYYGVPLVYSEPRPGFAFCLQAHTGIPSSRGARHEVNGLAVPDVILLSKPDIFDPSGAAEAYMRKNDFKPVAYFKAFTAWEAPRPMAE